ncbi:MAG: fluoride efflux transporter CrcB [Alphaproteobacteria bacterium]|nr:fluoride efflux transporter CrcB [Alphaproteobacteria bacterium]
MPTVLLVALGGAAGAVLRWAAGLAVMQAGGQGWWATLGVNAAGGLAMGLFAGFVHDPLSPWRALVAVGLLGGFTTFSSFSLETMGMLQRQEFALALAYMIGSVIVSVGACGLGLMIARSMA